MDCKYHAFLSLLPCDNDSFISYLSDVYSGRSLDDAVLHRLKQCCSLFYENKFFESREVSEEV